MLKIQKCLSCGLHFVWPRLENHQEPYSKFTNESFEKKYGAIERGEKLHDRHQNYLEEVELVRTYGKDGAYVLDVGCNAGWLLGYLQKAGFRIEGVEPSPILKDIAIRRTGATIHNCYLHQVKDRDSAFDCITATDVIEHIPPEDINEFVDAIHHLLKPGGHAIIKTPNVPFTYVKHVITSKIPVRIRRLLLHKSLEVWDAKEHVLQWDSNTLAAMFKKHGFTVTALFVPKPIETAGTPLIAVMLRKIIFRLANLISKPQHVPWFAQDICLIAQRKEG